MHGWTETESRGVGEYKKLVLKGSEGISFYQKLCVSSFSLVSSVFSLIQRVIVNSKRDLLLELAWKICSSIFLFVFLKL